MNTNLKAKKPVRRIEPLPWELYRGAVAAVFSLYIEERKQLFTDGNIFSVFEKILLNECRWFDCAVSVYLFMPDHCHILMEGNGFTSEPLRASEGFRQKTGHWLLQHQMSFAWKNYFDHRLMKNKSEIEGQIRYILANPVRKGIAGNWHEYKYKGSTAYDLAKWT